VTVKPEKQGGPGPIGAVAPRRKQVRQCTENVTMMRVGVTIVAVEKQYVLHNLSMCLLP